MTLRTDAFAGVHWTAGPKNLTVIYAEWLLGALRGKISPRGAVAVDRRVITVLRPLKTRVRTLLKLKLSPFSDGENV